MLRSRVYQSPNRNEQNQSETNRTQRNPPPCPLPTSSLTAGTQLVQRSASPDSRYRNPYLDTPCAVTGTLERFAWGCGCTGGRSKMTHCGFHWVLLSSVGFRGGFVSAAVQRLGYIRVACCTGVLFLFLFSSRNLFFVSSYCSLKNHKRDFPLLVLACAILSQSSSSLSVSPLLVSCLLFLVSRLPSCPVLSCHRVP
jgi:hypothetical protein